VNQHPRFVVFLRYGRRRVLEDIANHVDGGCEFAACRAGTEVVAVVEL
jgi:hypothetical protein